MNRKIELTRIHAINWYGYLGDSFDVRGNLLVAGITGSGKSIIMDLIQLVLVAHQGKTRYNQSATGARSTRDLIGYCLGDTKQNVGPARQFMRDKGAITYVALDFTWPGGKRIETWGLRIEYDSAIRETPSRLTPFLIPASLTRDAFLTADRKPLDYLGFGKMLETHGGRTFDTPDLYRREMALPTHLNFDRTTLDYLLPAAMSFTFMDSFNDFCRRFILPAEDVNIQSVKDSYLVFQNLKKELGLLKDQLGELEQIAALDTQRIAAARDRDCAQYLEAECRRDHANDCLVVAQKRAADLEEELAGENAQLETLTAQIAEARQQLDDLKATLNETEDGKLFLHLRAENVRLVGVIDRLKGTGKTVGEAVQGRARQARLWVEKLDALSFAVDRGALKAVLGTAEQLATCEATSVRERVRQLAQAVSTALRVAREAAKPLERQAGDLEQQRVKLDKSLTALRLGMIEENTVLLAELNRRLPPRHGVPAAQALWQLCEVNDERWRAALEVAFGRKFAIVVSAEDYDKAEETYHELKHETPGESLIDPGHARDGSRKPLPSSLALKIDAEHPIARAVVDGLFGDVICVEHREELRKHPRAILRDGFMAQRPFVQRPRHYNNRPCIGRGGLEKQKSWLADQLGQITKQQAQLSPGVNAWQAAVAYARDSHLESENIHDDLAAAEQLPEREAELKRNLKQLSELRTKDLEAKEESLIALQNQLGEWERQKTTLDRSPRRHQLDAAQAAEKTADAEAKRRADEFEALTGKPDVSVHLARLNELRLTVLTEFPAKDVAAQKFNGLFHAADKEADTARTALVAERKALRAHAEYGQRYLEYDPEAADNARYDDRLAKIRDGDIRTYEEKSQREELNWQQLFRTQVLEKLRAALHEVDDLIALLQQQLREPIGNNRYRITHEKSGDKEYEMYRQLIDLSAHVRDGELLFASADAEVRETIEELFDKLVKQPESTQALAFLDYRRYHDYDMLVEDVREPDSAPSSLNKHSGMFSGGENQAPFFIAILACYLRAYRRFITRRREPSLALVPIDEAFSKLSGNCIQDCFVALRYLDLQGVFSMSTGNIPYAIDHCDQVIAVHKEEKTVARKKRIRNIAVTLTREAAYERFAGGKRRE